MFTGVFRKKTLFNGENPHEKVVYVTYILNIYSLRIIYVQHL